MEKKYNCKKYVKLQKNKICRIIMVLYIYIYIYIGKKYNPGVSQKFYSVLVM